MYKTPLYRKLIMRLRGQTTTEQLMKAGMKVGSHFSRRNDVFIDGDHAYLIEFGDHVTLAGGVRILAHDASTNMFLGYTRIGKVKIGSHVFLGANCTILPGVTIGDNVIIGAGGVVTHDIPSHSVAAGNPARVICNIEEYLEKNKAQLNLAKVSSDFRELSVDKKMEELSKIETKRFWYSF